jgi:hypothetical protein
MTMVIFEPEMRLESCEILAILSSIIFRLEGQPDSLPRQNRPIHGNSGIFRCREESTKCTPFPFAASIGRFRGKNGIVLSLCNASIFDKIPTL